MDPSFSSTSVTRQDTSPSNSHGCAIAPSHITSVNASTISACASPETTMPCVHTTAHWAALPTKITRWDSTSSPTQTAIGSKCCPRRSDNTSATHTVSYRRPTDHPEHLDTKAGVDSSISLCCLHPLSIMIYALLKAQP